MAVRGHDRARQEAGRSWGMPDPGPVRPNDRVRRLSGTTRMPSRARCSRPVVGVVGPGHASRRSKRRRNPGVDEDTAGRACEHVSALRRPTRAWTRAGRRGPRAARRVSVLRRPTRGWAHGGTRRLQCAPRGQSQGRGRGTRRLQCASRVWPKGVAEERGGSSAPPGTAERPAVPRNSPPRTTDPRMCLALPRSHPLTARRPQSRRAKVERLCPAMTATYCRPATS